MSVRGWMRCCWSRGCQTPPYAEPTSRGPELSLAFDASPTSWPSNMPLGFPQLPLICQVSTLSPQRLMVLIPSSRPLCPDNPYLPLRPGSDITAQWRAPTFLHPPGTGGGRDSGDPVILLAPERREVTAVSGHPVDQPTMIREAGHRTHFQARGPSLRVRTMAHPVSQERHAVYKGTHGRSHHPAKSLD